MADMSPILPEKVTVYYPNRRCKGNLDQEINLWRSFDWKLEDTEFTDPDIESNVYSGVANSVMIIHDTCQALTAVGNEATNQTALEDLTSQIAQDFYDFRSFTADFVYNGICAIQPTALWDYIEFIYDADRPSSEDQRTEAKEELLRPNFATRCFTEPWNGEVQELQHMDPAISECTDANNSNIPISPVPCIYFYSGEIKCSAGGGKAEATIDDDGAISSVTVTKAGKYTGTPRVAISGDGHGAKLTAVLGSSGLESVTIDDGGEDYTYAIISFDGGGGSLQLTKMMLCLEDGRLVERFISYEGVG